MLPVAAQQVDEGLHELLWSRNCNRRVMEPATSRAHLLLKRKPWAIRCNIIGVVLGQDGRRIGQLPGNFRLGIDLDETWTLGETISIGCNMIEIEMRIGERTQWEQFAMRTDSLLCRVVVVGCPGLGTRFSKNFFLLEDLNGYLDKLIGDDNVDFLQDD